MEKPYLIGLTGKGGAGKDTVADYLVDKYGFLHLKFGTVLYEIARKYFGMEEKDRNLLQDIGKAMRSVDPLFFVNFVEREILKNPEKNIVISDLRQGNEKAILENFSGKRKLVLREVVADFETRRKRQELRDGVIIPESVMKAQEQRPIETEMDSWHLPALDNNEDMESLYRKVDELLKGEN